MTIYDISEKAGVSIATVSRVLNGSAKVSPATRKKVLDVIDACGYAPNAFARGLGLHSLRTIGILCADSSDLFLAKAVYYLEQTLQEHGYESLLCCTGYHQEVRRSYMDLILSKKVDSIILVGSNFIGTTGEENQYIREASAQVPIMLLNASYDYPNVYSILCDDYTSMYEAAAAMLNAGITEILYLYNSLSYSGRRKLDGFTAAVKERGIPDYERLIHRYPGDPQQMSAVADFVAAAAEQSPAFHGVIASEDPLAIGAMKYAAQRGIRVPEDLSVIGYNNSMLADCCTPELTSVDNRLKTQTHQLVQTLLRVLDGEEMPKQSVFSGKLIRRGSTIF